MNSIMDNIWGIEVKEEYSSHEEKTVTNIYFKHKNYDGLVCKMTIIENEFHSCGLTHEDNNTCTRKRENNLFDWLVEYHITIIESIKNNPKYKLLLVFCGYSG